MSAPRSTSAAARWFAFVVVFAAIALPSRAGAGHWVGGVRLGTMQPGPNGSLKSGFEFGGVIDHVDGGALDFGLGVDLVTYAAESPDPGLTIFIFEGHARTSTVKRPAYFEAGLGAYTRSGLELAYGPGGFVGSGYEWRKSSALRIGLGATYHMMFGELSITDGFWVDYQDFFTLGATLRW